MFSKHVYLHGTRWRTRTNFKCCAQFTQAVMDSKNRDATALNLQVDNMSSSADAGNNEMMLKRKVRMCFRDLRRAFKDLDRSGDGVLTMEDFRFALHRMDIILSEQQFKELVRKIDQNGDGQISYAEFLDYFRQEEDQLGLTKVDGITTEAAIEMVRTKIGEKMDGRVGALRRAFQFFDADGSGAIDKDELKRAMMLKCGLVFEENLLQRIIDALDDDGSGLIGFRKFCEMVMGSKKRGGTGLQLQVDNMSSSADAGNNEMMLKRKVRMCFRDLRRAFKDLDRSGDGVLTMEDFRFALHRMDIILSEQQFKELVRKIDQNGDGQISYAEFLDYFRQEEDQLGLTKVDGITTEAAIEMVRTKIGEKMDGREGALRRAFQFFDADGSGAIDKDELKRAMMLKCGLVFEENLLQRIIDALDDDGSGLIDFRKFCEMVMGSKNRDANTIDTFALRGRSDHVSDDAGNSQMMLYRKVTEKRSCILVVLPCCPTSIAYRAWRESPSVIRTDSAQVRMSAKDLRNIFKDLDPMGTGRVPIDEFKYALHRLHIDMTKRQFNALLRKIGSVSSKICTDSSSCAPVHARALCTL
eukprot:SAG11_NODE_1093_length_5906_cov_10.683313_1_plen_584_part_00